MTADLVRHALLPRTYVLRLDDDGRISQSDALDPETVAAILDQRLDPLDIPCPNPPAAFYCAFRVPAPTA